MTTKSKERKYGLAEYSRLFVSSFAGSILNPNLFLQSQAQGFGQLIAVALRLLEGPAEAIPPRRVRTPFDGRWKVLNGGTTKQSSHSWDLLSQRYAYDFVVEGDDGRTYRGDGRRLEDYHAYGRPVLAPADGVVIQLVDGIRDYHRPGHGWVDWRTRDIRGNFVVIQHDEHVYSLIAHLQPGSFQVKKGDRVTQGCVIGRCGNSGNSTEPHIHFQLQDRRSFFLSIGIPVQFSRSIVERRAPGVEQVAERRYAGVVEQGDYVEAASSADTGEEDHGAPPLTRVGVRDLFSSLGSCGAGVVLAVVLARFVAQVLGFVQS
ncbi:M23 family metallopeptidase [Sorangium sp. So ce321]|uniref:M23 family metallopeptidase n=1 Tax=Sorangium sp. So ce321 TaxID=3133300 RepID=UPI003F60F7E6